MHLSSAKYSIGAGITEKQNSIMPFGLVFSSDLFGMQPANLKYVFKMGFERERERQFVTLNVVVVDGDYVVYGQPVSVDYPLQVHSKGLDRNGFCAGNLQFRVCELEFGNRAPVCPRSQDVRGSTREPDAVPVQVPAIMVVEAKAVLILGGKLAILLG